MSYPWISGNHRSFDFYGARYTRPYPLAGVPSALRTVARVNPVTYQVDLMRHALGQSPEFGLTFDLLALLGSSILALALAGALFDPERRFLASVGGARR